MAWNKTETKPFERIIIETSGVASPEPIIDTLLREPWLSKRYLLQQIVATVAIPFAISKMERHAEARAQIAWSDLLILTHADQADATQQSKLIDYLKRYAPATPTLTAIPDPLDFRNVQTKSPLFFQCNPAGPASPEHGFRSVSLYLDNAPSWPWLQAALQSLLLEYPDDLVRIKGVVYPPESTEPLAVHAVAGYLYPPLPLPERPNQDRRSRLVLITISSPEQLARKLSIHLDAEFSRDSNLHITSH